MPKAAQLAAWLVFPYQTSRALRRRYGAPYTMRFPAWPAVVTFGDPEANREIFTMAYDEASAAQANEPLRPIVGPGSLLLLDDDRHRRERKLLMPPFHGARMVAYGEAMRAVTERAVAGWPIGEVFGVQPHTQSITLDIILRTVFGAEEGASLERLREAVVGLIGDFSGSLMVRALHVDLGPRSPWGRFRRTRSRTHERLFEFIEERRADPTERGDILEMLLRARYEDGAPMSREALRDELLTLLVAGHETTATALSWALLHLAANPSIQRRVHAELDAAGADAALDVGRASGLDYLDAVVKETLRLHPVIAAVGRVLHKPHTISGWELPAKTLVAASIYLTHHNPDVYARPHAFDPEHFFGHRRSPQEFLPFGGGVRRCIGAAFALYEMRVVLATILSTHRVRPAPGRRVKPTRRNVTIGPSRDAPIVLELR